MPSTKARKKPPIQKEPWLNRTQKIAAAIVAVFAVIGFIWGAVSWAATKVDNRYAKEKIVKEMKIELAMLSSAFQYDQLNRAVDGKSDMIIKINLRLSEKISDKERAQLEEVKRKLEREIEDLKSDQKKIEERQRQQLQKGD